MSTLQQIKQTTKSTVSTAISNEQSQKLIQTMLTMSFGCLAFLRGLFPDENFIDQKFVPEKLNKNYDRQKISSIRIKTLLRGKSAEADLFLDWLEKGVFPTIKLQYLKAMSLGIFVNEKKPNELLEDYLFSFNYENNGVAIKVNESESISLLDSRKMVQQLMRRFIIITQSLDPLPEQRFLTMRLLFNESAPKDFQPMLFKDVSLEPKSTIKIPSSTNLDAYGVGSLITNHHSVSIKILSLVDRENKNQLGAAPQLIDPFELVHECKSVENTLDSLSCLSGENYKNQSQTTNMLQKFLKPSSNNFTPTQMLDNTSNMQNPSVNCDCGIPIASSLIRPYKCMTCLKYVHGICYGNYRGSYIPKCITCTMSSKINVSSIEFKMLMMLRRIYRFFCKRPELPGKLSELYEILCSDQLDSLVMTLINNALTILFHDKVLEIDSKRRLTKSGGIMKCSNFIEVDKPGIYTLNGPLLPGKYVWTFLYNSPSAKSCYVDTIPENEEQVNEWLIQVQELISNIDIEPLPVNLGSLKIEDDTQDPIFTGKRKHIHIEDNSVSIDTQPMEPIKLRKISVSKKTLKSVW